MFALEALNARHGDALLVHFGPDDDPGVIVCDAGPSGTYGGILRPRLSVLKDERSPSHPLAIDLLMVSHLDDDHIHGVVDLLADLRDRADNEEALPWIVRRLWVNQFDDLVGDGDEEVTQALAAALEPDGSVKEGLAAGADALAVAASVPQGQSVRDDARRLHVDVNGAPFDGLVAAAAGSVDVDLGRGLVATVVAPSTAQVQTLHREWDEIIRKKAEKPDETLVEAAEYLDRSVFNLSSIVVLARAFDRTMLLTGDARGDHILESLRSAGLMKDGKLHVSLFKLPHHGSIRNVEMDFFEGITADHYVISADGRDGNPEVETLQMLSAARTDDRFAIHVTNSIPHVDNFFAQERAAGREYDVFVREQDRPSVVISLA